MTTHGVRSRRILVWASLAAVLMVLFLVAIPILMTGDVFQNDDFMEYWAAGRLNSQGLNPYSTQLLEALQQPLGRQRTVIMYNPPYTLAVTMPFSWLPYPLGRISWYLFSVALVAVAASWIWDLAGAPRRLMWLAWAITFLFAPVLNALHAGQISPLLLFGMAAFLHFAKAGKLWSAGALAALIAIKPHWMYLFWIVLLFWCFDRRKWTPLLGATVSLVAGVLVAVLFNPTVVSQFLGMALTEPPIDWATPTLGGLLRTIFGPDHTWLQFVPLFLGAVWLALYYRAHRRNWDWEKHLPWVVLMSAVTAAFGWTGDQVVLLVAVVPAFYWLVALRSRMSVAFLALGLCLNLVVLVMRGEVTDAWFWWFAPACLVWYWAAYQLVGRSRTKPSGSNVPVEVIGVQE